MFRRAILIVLVLAPLYLAMPIETERESEENALIENDDRFEGDIIRPRVSFYSARPNVKKKWTGGVVPYVLLPSSKYGEFTTARWRNIMRDAMGAIENNTRVDGKDCIRFIPRTDQNDYLEIDPDDSGCGSPVGKQGGKQLVGINPLCGLRSTTHELIHALGFWHEQSRFDRDKYLDVHWENIKPRSRSNFAKFPMGLILTPYDYDSIMHYHMFTFSMNGMPTITAKNEMYRELGGEKMSPLDAKKIQIYYGCVEPDGAQG